MTTSLSARVLEAVMRSGCGRVETVVASGETPVDLRLRLDLPEPREPESQVAKKIGDQFEDFLTKNGGKRLVALYAEALGVEPVEIAYHSYDVDRDDYAAVAAARADFVERLRVHLHEPGPTTLIAQAPLHYVSADQPIDLRPDAVLLHTVDGQPRVRVGEIKAQYDLGGYTAPHAVHRAVLQTAYGVYGLRLVASGLTDQPVDQIVAPQVDLIMRGAQAVARLRTIEVNGELVAIAGFFRRIAEQAAPRIDDHDMLRSIPHVFTPACVGSCPLAEDCQTEAEERGHALRGHPGTKVLIGLGVDPERAAALAAGAPADASEADVARWLVSP